jgi:cytochrome c2
LVLVVAVFLAAASILVSLSLKPTFQTPALLIGVLILLICIARTISVVTKAAPAASETNTVSEAFYDLKITYHRDSIVREEATGGGIAKLGEHYLLVTGDGQFHRVDWDSETGRLKLEKLLYRVPFNREEFIRDTAKRNDIATAFFRTGGIVAQESRTGFRLFVSHHYWNREKECTTIRVSMAVGSYLTFAARDSSISWETIFESNPCMKFKKISHPFAGHIMGGRLALLNPDKLVLALGDQGFDGLSASVDLVQDATASYGKTILIELDTRVASIYSAGHRNPQGLHVDRQGNIWSTEHGPRGGDELNLILEGRNYGWPIVTYGTGYGKRSWPLNPMQGRHEGFERPVYVWMPSIGISNFIRYQGELFKLWQDDLLVSSLGGKSLWRVRLDEGRVIFAERIPIGQRIRDIIEGPRGRLFLWTEASFDAPTEGMVVTVEPSSESTNERKGEAKSNPKRGEMLFGRCAECHSLDSGNIHGIGPNLKGVYGRRIAAAKGYAYSAAFRQLTGTWTAENLDGFLANPQSFSPGSLMRSGAVADPIERAELIEYLKSQR